VFSFLRQLILATFVRISFLVVRSLVVLLLTHKCVDNTAVSNLGDLTIIGSSIICGP
jgi:hypothetical protein